jgi:CheY-like chemotaxis protein
MPPWTQFPDWKRRVECGLRRHHAVDVLTSSSKGNPLHGDSDNRRACSDPAVSSPRPRVLLADDDAAILNAFERLLTPSCDVVGCVSDVGALLEAASRLQPDVIVVDLFMPTDEGLETCRQLKGVMPRARIVVVSGANDAATRTNALKAGASAFVSKIQAADDLLPAIQEAITA